jgi:hypothetical protein
MKIRPEPNIYNQAQRFAEITKILVMTGNIKRLKTCLQKAEDFFNNGTSEIKNAISNVYVFSVSSFMEIHHYSVKELFPQALQKEYYKQINASGV